MDVEKEALDTFIRLNALIRDSHIVYTSGRHGKAYVNKDAVYPHTKEISRLCLFIAQEFKDKNVEIVLAPALGGIILTQWVAFHLSELTGREVLAVYAEKVQDGSFVIKRGYDKLIKDKRVLILEDIVNTGGSVEKVFEMAKAMAREVVGVACLCNRSGQSKGMIDGIELYSLFSLNLESWAAVDCPMCKSQIPIEKSVGKGNKKS